MSREAPSKEHPHYHAICILELSIRVAQSNAAAAGGDAKAQFLAEAAQIEGSRLLLLEALYD